MALIDQLDLAILAALSFASGVILGIPLGYGIRPRHRRIVAFLLRRNDQMASLEAVSGSRQHAK